MTAEEIPKLIGTGEAARILRVSDNTIHRWVKEGRLQVAQVLPSGYRRFELIEVKRLKEAITPK